MALPFYGRKMLTEVRYDLEQCRGRALARLASKASAADLVAAADRGGRFSWEGGAFIDALSQSRVGAAL